MHEMNARRAPCTFRLFNKSYSISPVVSQSFEDGNSNHLGGIGVADSSGGGPDVHLKRARPLGGLADTVVEAEVRQARLQARKLRAHELIRTAFKGAGRQTASEQMQDQTDDIDRQYKAQSPIGSLGDGPANSNSPDRPFSHIEAAYKGRMGAIDPDSLPEVGTRTVIFSTEESRLIRGITWVLGVKTAACAGGAAFLFFRQMGYMLEQSFAEMDALTSAVGGAASGSLPGATLAPALLCGVLALFGRVQLQRGPFRVVTRMTRVIESDSDESDGGTPSGSGGHSSGKREMIEIEHMSLLGTTRFTIPREMLACGEPNSNFTSFVVMPVGTFFLFPSEGWSSDDIDYLRTLVFWAYFRDDHPEPPADHQLIEIEGFGPYRPAALADPSHASARQIRESDVSSDALAGTDMLLKDGEVYARFTVHPRITAQSLVDAIHRKSPEGNQERLMAGSSAESGAILAPRAVSRQSSQTVGDSRPELFGQDKDLSEKLPEAVVAPELIKGAPVMGSVGVGRNTLSRGLSLRDELDDGSVRVDILIDHDERTPSQILCILHACKSPNAPGSRFRLRLDLSAITLEHNWSQAQVQASASPLLLPMNPECAILHKISDPLTKTLEATQVRPQSMSNSYIKDLLLDESNRRVLLGKKIGRGSYAGVFEGWLQTTDRKGASGEACESRAVSGSTANAIQSARRHTSSETATDCQEGEQPVQILVALKVARSQALLEDIRHESAMLGLLKRSGQVARALGVTQSGCLLLQRETRDLANLLHMFGHGLPSTICNVTFLQLAHGIRSMHLINISHRDLKPQNVLCGRELEGAIRLADFGLARFDPDPRNSGPRTFSADSRSVRLLRPNRLNVQADVVEGGPVEVHPMMSEGMVTLWWRPPEILMRSNKYCGKKADVWSLGIILLEMITGVNPLFTRDCPTELKATWDILRCSGVPTQETCPGLWRQISSQWKSILSTSMPQWKWSCNLAKTGNFAARGSPVIRPIARAAAATVAADLSSEQGELPASGQEYTPRWSGFVINLLRQCIRIRQHIFSQRQESKAAVDPETKKAAGMSTKDSLFRGPAMATSGKAEFVDFDSPKTSIDHGRSSSSASESFGFDPLLLDLLDRMLQIDPDRRATIEEVVSHPWFDDSNVLIVETMDAMLAGGATGEAAGCSDAVSKPAMSAGGVSLGSRSAAADQHNLSTHAATLGKDTLLREAVALAKQRQKQAYDSEFQCRVREHLTLQSNLRGNCLLGSITPAGYSSSPAGAAHGGFNRWYDDRAEILDDQASIDSKEQTPQLQTRKPLNVLGRAATRSGSTTGRMGGLGMLGSLVSGKGGSIFETSGYTDPLHILETSVGLDSYSDCGQSDADSDMDIDMIVNDSRSSVGASSIGSKRSRGLADEFRDERKTNAITVTSARCRQRSSSVAQRQQCLERQHSLPTTTGTAARDNSRSVGTKPQHVLGRSRSVSQAGVIGGSASTWLAPASVPSPGAVMHAQAPLAGTAKSGLMRLKSIGKADGVDNDAYSADGAYSVISGTSSGTGAFTIRTAAGPHQPHAMGRDVAGRRRKRARTTTDRSGSLSQALLAVAGQDESSLTASDALDSFGAQSPGGSTASTTADIRNAFNRLNLGGDGLSDRLGMKPLQLTNSTGHLNETSSLEKGRLAGTSSSSGINCMPCKIDDAEATRAQSPCSDSSVRRGDRDLTADQQDMVDHSPEWRVTASSLKHAEAAVHKSMVNFGHSRLQRLGRLMQTAIRSHGQCVLERDAETAEETLTVQLAMGGHLFRGAHPILEHASEERLQLLSRDARYKEPRPNRFPAQRHPGMSTTDPFYENSVYVAKITAVKPKLSSLACAAVCEVIGSHLVKELMQRGSSLRSILIERCVDEANRELARSGAMTRLSSEVVVCILQHKMSEDDIPDGHTIRSMYRLITGIVGTRVAGIDAQQRSRNTGLACDEASSEPRPLSVDWSVYGRVMRVHSMRQARLEGRRYRGRAVNRAHTFSERDQQCDQDAMSTKSQPVVAAEKPKSASAAKIGDRPANSSSACVQQPMDGRKHTHEQNAAKVAADSQLHMETRDGGSQINRREPAYQPMTDTDADTGLAAPMATNAKNAVAQIDQPFLTQQAKFGANAPSDVGNQSASKTRDIGSATLLQRRSVVTASKWQRQVLQDQQDNSQPAAATDACQDATAPSMNVPVFPTRRGDASRLPMLRESSHDSASSRRSTSARSHIGSEASTSAELFTGTKVPGLAWMGTRKPSRIGARKGKDSAFRPLTSQQGSSLDKESVGNASPTATGASAGTRQGVGLFQLSLPSIHHKKADHVIRSQGQFNESGRLTQRMPPRSMQGNRIGILDLVPGHGVIEGELAATSSQDDLDDDASLILGKSDSDDFSTARSGRTGTDWIVGTAPMGRTIDGRLPKVEMVHHRPNRRRKNLPWSGIETVTNSYGKRAAGNSKHRERTFEGKLHPRLQSEYSDWGSHGAVGRAIQFPQTQEAINGLQRTSTVYDGSSLLSLASDSSRGSEIDRSIASTRTVSGFQIQRTVSVISSTQALMTTTDSRVSSTDGGHSDARGGSFISVADIGPFPRENSADVPSLMQIGQGQGRQGRGSKYTPSDTQGSTNSWTKVREQRQLSKSSKDSTPGQGIHGFMPSNRARRTKLGLGESMGNKIGKEEGGGRRKARRKAGADAAAAAAAAASTVVDSTSTSVAVPESLFLSVTTQRDAGLRPNHPRHDTKGSRRRLGLHPLAQSNATQTGDNEQLVATAMATTAVTGTPLESRLMDGSDELQVLSGVLPPVAVARLESSAPSIRMIHDHRSLRSKSNRKAATKRSAPAVNRRRAHLSSRHPEVQVVGGIGMGRPEFPEEHEGVNSTHVERQQTFQRLRGSPQSATSPTTGGSVALDVQPDFFQFELGQSPTLRSWVSGPKLQ